MKKTLIVGAGEAGTILANTIKKELDRRGAEGYLFKTINSSKNDSNKATDIPEENRFLLEDIGGMAKEMEKVAEIMQEQGRKVLTNIFSEVMSGSIDGVAPAFPTKPPLRKNISHFFLWQVKLSIFYFFKTM